MERNQCLLAVLVMSESCTVAALKGEIRMSRFLVALRLRSWEWVLFWVGIYMSDGEEEGQRVRGVRKLFRKV